MLNLINLSGLQLENYVHADIGNASISVLKGSTIVEILQDDENDKFYANVTLTEGQSMQVSDNTY